MHELQLIEISLVSISAETQITLNNVFQALSASPE